MKRTVIIGKRSFQIDLGFIGILCLLCFVSCFSLYNAFNLVKTGTGFLVWHRLYNHVFTHFTTK